MHFSVNVCLNKVTVGKKKKKEFSGTLSSSRGQITPGHRDNIRGGFHKDI